MPAYLEEWTAGEGPDNFANDPSNATLSVFEPGLDENTLAVVEISHPVIDGNDLVYHYKLIEGTMPKDNGAAALFIDWIGVGGGVGPGFHDYPPAAAPPPAASGGTLPLETVVHSLPAGCIDTPVGGVEYYHCGANYYRAVFQGNTLVYVTAQP